MKNLWILILAMLSIGLLACSKSSQSEESATPKELVYWSLWNKPEPQAQALNSVVEKFAKEEGGAQIKMIYNGRQALVKLRSYLAADKQVDLFDGDGDQYLGLVTKEDFAYDISDVINGKDYSGSQNLRDTLLTGTADVMEVDGVQYGIPYILNIIAFFYSKQSFQTAGITNPPQTFEELLDASKKLLAKDIAPIALEGNVGFYQFWFLSSIMQKVAGDNFLYNAIMDKSGKSWDAPEFRAALTIEQRLIDSGAIPPESSGYQYPAAQNNIAIGKTAMELVGSWLPTELSQAVNDGFEWGIFPFPDVPNGQNANKIAIAPMTIGIYQMSKNVETAKLFIKYLLSESSQQEIVSLSNVGVPNKNITWPTDLQDAKNLLLNAEGAYLSNGNLSAFLPDFTANTFTPLHTKFILGKISIDEFIETIKEGTIKYWQ